MIGVLLSLVAGAAFLAIARWGRRNAATLVPAHLTASSQAARARSLRRGAITCTVTGWLFLAFAALALVDLVR